MKTGEVKGKPASSNIVDEDGATVKYSSGKANTKPSIEQRLSSLETKVGAIVYFITEMVVCEVELLGSNYRQHMKALKNIDMLKTSLKDFGHELDEAQEQVEKVETSFSYLQKENKHLKAKMKQLKTVASSEIKKLTNDSEIMSKRQAELNEMLESVTDMLSLVKTGDLAGMHQFKRQDKTLAGEKGMEVGKGDVSNAGGKGIFSKK